MRHKMQDELNERLEILLSRAEEKLKKYNELRIIVDIMRVYLRNFGYYLYRFEVFPIRDMIAKAPAIIDGRNGEADGLIREIKPIANEIWGIGVQMKARVRQNKRGEGDG